MKYVFLFLMLVLFSCSKPEENYVQIPSEFAIFVSEEIVSKDQRVLWLELHSMNSDYCPDDSLEYQSFYDQSLLNIDIEDSYKSNDCFQRKSFLRTKIRIPDFTDSLQVKIKFSSSVENELTIFNSKNYYLLNIRTGPSLTNKYEKTYKIPHSLIWGYAYPKTIGPTSDVHMSNFRKDIEFDCYINYLPKGYYSYFSILDGNVLLLNENPGIAGSYLNFYYTHTKTEEELNTFFNGLAAKYFNLVGYKINSGIGIQFSSN